MALIPALQDEAERVQRRADQQAAMGNRRIAGYNTQADNLKGMMATDKATVENYNKQYEGFRESALKSYDTNPDGELWNVIGYYGYSPNSAIVPWSDSGEAKPRFGGTGWHHPSWGVINTGNVWTPIGGPAIGFEGGQGKRTTFRDLRTGDPLPSGDSWMSSPLIPIYATYNDRPFVKPPTEAEQAAAKAASETLKGYEPQIDSLNAQSESITRRNGLMQQRADRESERLNTDIEMNKRRIAEEQAGPPLDSVFDQNRAGVFQSIADWLR